jgi:hypothetical protein
MCNCGVLLLVQMGASAAYIFAIVELVLDPQCVEMLQILIITMVAVSLAMVYMNVFAHYNAFREKHWNDDLQLMSNAEGLEPRVVEVSPTLQFWKQFTTLTACGVVVSSASAVANIVAYSNAQVCIGIVISLAIIDVSNRVLIRYL